MIRSYRIRGAAQAAAKLPVTGKAVILKSSRRLLPGAARAAGDALEVQSDEVVRVEFDNGFVLWSRADDLIRERGSKALGRGADDELWEIGFQPPDDGRADARGARGWLGLAVKALEFFGVDVKKTVAEGIGSALEARLLGCEPAALYRCSLADAFALVPARQTKAEPGQPWLLFLHGTASSCQGSFG